MKKIISILTVIAFASSIAFAQDRSKGIRFMTYAGAGWFLPSAYMKENSMIGNGVNFSFGHFQSIGKPKKGVQLGAEVRLNYSKFEKDHWAPEQFDIMYYDDGSGVPELMQLKLQTEKKKPDAFHFLIGPAVLVPYKNFLFQPSLMLGYASVSQEKFHFYSSVPVQSNPGTDTAFNFYSGGHETNNGFVFVPGIKAGYRLHKNIAAFLSFEYSFGSLQKFTDSAYFPAGMMPPVNPVFQYDDLTQGTSVTYSRESKLRALILNFQIAFTLPR